MSGKILSLTELVAVRGRLRDDGKRVVQCHGCFDIVHPGHIRYLRFAKALGDVLVVSVSADDVVDKGFDRPYIGQDLRLENLAALEFVDHVCLSEHAWGGPVLEALKPDVYVKGREYETMTDARFAKEKAIVEAHGGEVVFSSGDIVFSSSAIIEQKREAFSLDAQKIQFFCQRHQVSAPSLAGILEQAREKRILVLGDPILDHYVYCEEPQVASEGPIVSVTPTAEEWFAGGGGLIARQLASCGAETTLITTIEAGPSHERLTRCLDRSGVRLSRIDAPARPTIVKTRYLVDGQKVFRVDTGHQAPLPASSVVATIALLETELANAEALVVTDLGFGLFGEQLCRALPEIATRLGKPYYADVSAQGLASVLKFHRPRIAVPTERELRFALGDMESGLSNIAAQYYRATQAQGLVLTLGRRGALRFDPPGQADARLKAAYLPALETPALDRVGAGDLFLSGLVLGDVARGDVAHGMYLGGALAALGVSRIGNDPISLPDLEAFLAQRPELMPG